MTTEGCTSTGPRRWCADDCTEGCGPQGAVAAFASLGRSPKAALDTKKPSRAREGFFERVAGSLLRQNQVMDSPLIDPM